MRIGEPRFRDPKEATLEIAVAQAQRRVEEAQADHRARLVALRKYRRQRKKAAEKDFPSPSSERT